jgi:HAD superfamily hydrolase (TIGR01509 family)
MKAPHGEWEGYDMNRTHTLFFDLGNVIVFFDRDKMYVQLADCLKIPLAFLQKNHKQHEQVMCEYEIGQLSSEDIYHYLQSQTNHPVSMKEILFALCDIFIPNYELWPLIETLKAAGSRLVLISNTNEAHFQFIFNQYSILKLFDDFVLSYQVGACKPSPLIFEEALKKARGQTFYTDDIPSFIEAGRKAGLDAELFTDVPSLKRQLQQRKLL